jgi:hypothetical protein
LLYGQDTPQALRDVKDLGSAPVGAKLFTDWLLRHADDLPAPLASVELVLSAPANAAPATSQYQWQGQPWAPQAGRDPRLNAAVSGTDGASVQQAGVAWGRRILANPKQTALVYICGHGAAVPTRSLVFLSDVAGGAPQYTAWQPFVDVQYLAGVMARLQGLKQGYVFVDACQEVITEAVFAALDKTQDLGETLRFFPQSFQPPSNKVLLLVPGPMGQLAYDDGQDGGGRFSQVLIEALSGAGAHNYTGTGQWGVVIDNLPRAMKALYKLRGWTRDGFDPTPVRTLVTDTPIMRCSVPPIVPFAVRLEPPEAINYAASVCLQDGSSIVIVGRQDQAEEWVDKAQARMGLCYLHAVFNGAGSPYQTLPPTPVDLSQMRVDPILVHRVV